MVKKRLVGVVTVKNGWAVQSFGYQKYLPLGKPECLVENLDRWGVGEILIQVIDRSSNEAGPDYELLDTIAHLGLGTPLIYGGGINSVEDGVKVIQSGADRIVVDSLLHTDLSVIEFLGECLGRQAVIASLPMAVEDNELKLLNYRTKTMSTINGDLLALIKQGTISEILLTDWSNEGNTLGFNKDLVELFPYDNVPLITFGGISSTEQMQELLDFPNVVAVSIGNFLSYKEHAVQKFKDALEHTSLRPSFYYATDYSS